VARLESDRIMFEIYRESSYDRRFRVVYFTELTERNRDLEIARAMDGEHVMDGFISLERSLEAKAAITALLERLNAGEPLPAELLKEALGDYAA
jgi:hypothetical protein